MDSFEMTDSTAGSSGTWSLFTEEWCVCVCVKPFPLGGESGGMSFFYPYSSLGQGHCSVTSFCLEISSVTLRGLLQLQACPH